MNKRVKLLKRMSLFPIKERFPFPFDKALYFSVDKKQKLVLPAS